MRAQLAAGLAAVGLDKQDAHLCVGCAPGASHEGRLSCTHAHPTPLPLAAKAPACAHTTRCAAVASRRWRRGASCGQTSLTRVRAARHACRMRRACACVTPHAHTRASGAAPPRAGTVSASYTLSVANCSVGITPVEARRLALEANTTDQIAPFQVCAPPSRLMASSPGPLLALLLPALP